MDKELKEIQEILTNAECHIEIDINKGASTCRVCGDSGVGILIGIIELCMTAEKKTGKSMDEMFMFAKSIKSMSDIIDCESKEQMDVMREILKKRDKE